MKKLTQMNRQDVLRWITGRSAACMFSLALIFLICQAVLVVIWVDVPIFSESVRSTLEPGSPLSQRIRLVLGSHVVDPRIQSTAVFILLAIWPVVIAEAVFHWMTRPWDKVTRRSHFFGLLFCLCPSMRMCARSPEMGNRIWFPGLGWRQPNKRLRKRLERQFSVPMIAIAMLILPVLVFEFFLKAHVAEHAWLRLMLHISTGVIWFAFAAELVVMLSVADKKLQYCKSHWLDIAIILLPLISFLRSLRVLRATQALRLPQLTKMARVYRLRGTAMKALRALILLELYHRLVGTDTAKAIEKLRRQLADVEDHANEIRRRITRLERRCRDDNNQPVTQECTDQFSSDQINTDPSATDQSEINGPRNEEASVDLARPTSPINPLG